MPGIRSSAGGASGSTSEHAPEQPLGGRPEWPEMAAVLDREAFARPVSPEEPAGAWLRRDGLYAAVQEAMAARVADPAYGIEEKRADWVAVEKLCLSALTERTKDIYLAGCLLEALVVNHGAQGLYEGLWLVRALHEKFWSDFHPRPRENGSQEGRLNQLEALRRNFTRILDRDRKSVV